MFCSELAKAPGDGSVVSVSFRIKVQAWQEAIEKVRYRDNLDSALPRIQGEVAETAAQLIREKRNQEFFFLAKEIEFPLTKVDF